MLEQFPVGQEREDKWLKILFIHFYIVTIFSFSLAMYILAISTQLMLASTNNVQDQLLIEYSLFLINQFLFP